MMASDESEEGAQHKGSVLQTVYDRVLRPRLPRDELEVISGVPVRNAALFDRTDIRSFEAIQADALRRRVSPGDEVVVVGGGFGVTPTVAAQRVAPDGQVDVFEPCQSRAEQARETFSLAGVEEWVSVHEAAVGTLGPGTDADADTGGSKTISPADLPECDVLEIDCEGAELDILQGLDQRPRLVLIEVHPDEEVDESAVRDWLVRNDYRIVREGREAPDTPVFVALSEGTHDK